MSKKEPLARRAEVRFTFDGADITKSIKPYLLSLSYTDSEEDESDDLEVQLQDRDDIWLTEWLDAAVEAAASGGSSSGSSSGGAGGGTHTVVKGDTLWDIAAKYLGSGPRYTEIYELNRDIIENPHWIYPGQVLKLPDGAASPSGGSEEQKQHWVVSRLKMSAVIIPESWGNGSGSLPTGKFELDSVRAGGPPGTVTIRGTALPCSSAIRDTKKSKAWEAYHLSGIAREIAGRGGLLCAYESDKDPYYQRVEQEKQTDIKFLSELCQDAGISLKCTDGQLVLFDQSIYESKPPVLTIKRGGGKYISYDLGTSAAETQYASCRVSYMDPATGQCIEGTATASGEDAESGQCLEITAKVSSAAEAKALAEKRLRLKNKFTRTASFTLPGNTGLVAGVTLLLESWGGWDGKYIIKQAVHSVGSSGYTTKIDLRRIVEGY